MNEIKPTWIQRIKIYLFGYAYVEHRQQPGWSGPLPFYMFRCPEHGIVVDHPHGYWELWKGTIPVKGRRHHKPANLPPMHKGTTRSVGTQHD